jgi:hypothetical protein
MQAQNHIRTPEEQDKDKVSVVWGNEEELRAHYESQCAATRSAEWAACLESMLRELNLTQTKKGTAKTQTPLSR